MGYLAFAGAVGTAVLAVIAVGTLVFKGPAQHEYTPGSAQQAAVGAQTAGTSSGTQTAEQPAAGQPANTVQASAPDAAAGAKVYAKCKACHTLDKGGANKVGPNLWSIIGRGVASVEGFKYSKALTGLADKAWDVAFLSDYLAAPKKAVPGNKMAFAGLKKPEQRNNLIAYLAQQSDTPVAADQLGLAAAAPAAAAAQDNGADQDTQEPETGAAAVAGLSDPPAMSAEEKAKIDEKVAALKQTVAKLDYERARFHPIHFAPEISKASDAECLVCHQGILKAETRAASPAGVKAADSLAWYQTLDTYTGDQAMFHWRHMESPYAKQVMNLSCGFCHKGNDPREESADMQPGRKAFSASADKPAFTLRKMVNPTDTCLRCHGAMPSPEEIMGLEGPWHQVRTDMESEDAPNGCLSCHADAFRTVRHRVTYLKAKSIEEAAQTSSDVCYGCHGGRSWYRIAYPYPRTPWPDMDPEVPDWAKDRPTASDAEYQLKTEAAQ